MALCFKDEVVFLVCLFRHLLANQYPAACRGKRGERGVRSKGRVSKWITRFSRSRTLFPHLFHFLPPAKWACQPTILALINITQAPSKLDMPYLLQHVLSLKVLVRRIQGNLRKEAIKTQIASTEDNPWNVHRTGLKTKTCAGMALRVLPPQRPSD